MLKSLISSPFEWKGNVENEMNYEVEFLETLSTLTIRIKKDRVWQIFLQIQG